MTFANPLALLLLLVVIPLLLLIHMFWVMRQVGRTTTLHIWDVDYREPEITKSSFKRLRWDLLLFLQLLALLFVVLALAQPQFGVYKQGWPRTILVLDTSASMQATDTAGGRFEAARRLALTELEALQVHQEVMLLEAASRPRLIVPFTKDHGAVATAIKAIQPIDEVGVMEIAVKFAAELARNGPRCEVVLFTDAAFDAGVTGPQPDSIGSLRRHVVGSSPDNVGITLLEVRKNHADQSQYETFVSVTNYGREAKAFALTVTLDNTPLYQQTMTLAVGAQRDIVFPFDIDRGGILTVKINPEDHLSIDDVAWSVIPGHTQLNVLLVTTGNWHLEQTLKAYPKVQLQIITPVQFAAGVPDSDVVILDRFAPDLLRSGRYLLLNTVSANTPLEPVGEINWPMVVASQPDHPVMRYLELTDVAIEQALRVRVSGLGETLLEANETPLIFAWEEAGVRALFVGFDFTRSSMPMQAAMPLFVGNALDWLQPTQPNKSGQQLKAGQPLVWNVGDTTNTVRVIRPGGTDKAVKLRGANLYYTETTATGLYLAKAGDEERMFAVNLSDARESEINPGRAFPDNSNATDPLTQKYLALYNLWRIFTILAILALSIELTLYVIRLNKTFSRTAVVLRALGLLLLVLALLRPQFPTYTDSLHVAFVLDVSDSVSASSKREAIEQVREVYDTARSNDTSEFLMFAGDARRFALPTREEEAGEALASNPLGGLVTDTEQAIRLALAALPTQGIRRIALITDGNENRGSVLGAIQEAQEKGIAIYTVPVGGAQPGEALLYDMALPFEAKQGEPFAINVVCWSDGPRRGQLSLYRDGVPIIAQKVEMNPGKNIYSFQQLEDDVGFHVYGAVLDAQDDPTETNNQAVSSISIGGKPRVLYIEKDTNQGHYLRRALNAHDIRVDQVGADSLEATLSRLSQYDALILSNISAVNLSKSQMQTIQSYVWNQGGGLVMLGGVESFGAGGYFRTPVEETLPVRMEARRKIEVPPISVVLVIDRSGSMNIEQGSFSRMDLAKEAARLAVEMVSKESEVGVITFDVDWNWAVPIAPAKDKDLIIHGISDINAGGGGTELYEALEEAYRAISASNTLLKHVIILSDGETHIRSFFELLQEMTRERITVSSVAISSDAGVELLENISRWGYGRSYYTADAYQLPRILTIETRLASKTAFVEGQFRPIVKLREHEILQGIDWSRVPSLRGYVRTTPKAMAETLLASQQEEPILSVWRYGLGRSAAFTSDVKTKWGVEWLQWRDVSQFLAQLVRWTIRSGERSDINTTVRLENDRGELIIETIDGDGKFINFLNGEFGVVAPDGSRTVLPIVQTGPGQYRGSFVTAQPGAYRLGVTVRNEDQTLVSQLRGATKSYPPEYKLTAINEPLLQTLAESTGGRVLDNLKQIFRLDRQQSIDNVDAWPWLLVVTILLLFSDLAARRLRGSDLGRRG